MSVKKVLIAIDSSMDADFILEKSDQYLPKEGDLEFSLLKWIFGLETLLYPQE